MKELILKKGQKGEFCADSDFTIIVETDGTVKIQYDSCFIIKSITDKEVQE